MKKWVAVLAVLISIAAGTIADAEDAPWLTFSTQLATNYVHQQSGYEFSKDPGLMSEVILEPKFAKGFYLYLWNFSSLHNSHDDELNYAVGWWGEVGPVEVDAGVIYYDTRKFFDNNWDYYSLYLELAKTFKVNPKNELKPFARMENVFPAMKDSPQGGGNYFTAGLQHEIKLTEKLSYKHSASVTYDTGTGGLNQAWIGGYDGKLAYKVNKHLELNPIIVTARTPLNSPGDGRESAVSAAAGITLYAF